MVTPLLQTKLNVPVSRPGLVSRPRVIERLDVGLERKLTLVSAPAGFGKTTLLVEWARHLGPRKTAWISLDAGDNDATRFFAYLIGALQSIGDGLGENILSALQAPQQPHVESIVTSLINEIMSLPPGRQSWPILLVLDDYHLISSQPVHAALAFLLEHSPPQLHIAMATRADPPLPVARLRARDQLTEIRERDLRFTPQEASALLKKMNLNLSKQDLFALETRTEGWVTGLQLAALAIAGEIREQDGRIAAQPAESASQFIQDFATSNRYIIDYLGEEVLNRLDDDDQSFLLQTSILERLSGSLCDAVTAQSGSEIVLERLEGANLFLVPLDAGRRWYRYHRLFADSLRHRLQRTHRELAPELQRRAARWYEDHGFVSEAIDHWITADAYTEAARLIEKSAQEALGRGELMTLVGWTGRLPAELVSARPRLCIFSAWTLLLTGQPGAVEARLRDAESALAVYERPGAGGERLTEGEIQDTLGHIAAIRAYLVTFSGDAPRVGELAQEAMERLSPDNLYLRSVVAFILGGACLMNDDGAGAASAFAEAVVMGRASGNIHLALPALCAVAALQETQGRLHQAAETYRDGLLLAAGRDGQPLPIGAGACTGLGELLYQWNDLDAAVRHLELGVELASQWGNVETLVNGQVSLAQVRTAQGDQDGALSALRDAESALRGQAAMPGTDATLAASRVRLYLEQGKMSSAARYLAERGVIAADPPSVLRELEQIALARVLIAQSRPESMPFLARLLEAAEQGGRMGRVIQMLTLQALALQEQGESDRALSSLERALRLAEPEGYVRVFLDEGPAMGALLARVAGRTRAYAHTQAYASKLLAAFGQDHAYASSDDGVLVEPLSARELEVLRLIAAGLSNQEIADQLVIALGTVKAHTSSIYGKLDVRSRTKAVARAQELDLL